MTRTLACFVFFAALLGPRLAAAQAHQHHAMPPDTTGAPTHARGARTNMPHRDYSDMGMSSMRTRHAGHASNASMPGAYGPYAMTREASGTSWQPQAARHDGIHLMRGPWAVMFHGFADVVYDHQGGHRGDEQVFASNMGMAMAQRSIGPGTLGLRSMLSLEPATIGRDGYPLLLQTGETANGRTPLIDHQHPHDLFMELAASYSVSSGDRSLFVYGGLPGEPALGPPAFMHRFSGVSLPTAPITHHWLDSTHITFGVLTAGAVADRVKVEASAFRGREPDEERWDIENPKLDSHAFRLSVNPADRWAMQVSHGRLHHPEQLEPGVDQDRTTASVMYDGPLGDAGRVGATIAWGRNRNRPGHLLDAWMAEATAEWAGRHAIFARAERAAKDELFAEPDPREGRAFEVGSITAGYRCDAWTREHASLGIGAAATLAAVPRTIRDAYGASPASLLIFLHAALR